MSAGRYVVVGLARVRVPWFAAVAGWSSSSALPVEFQKCVSATEARARLSAGRPVSALLVDAGAPGLDRDLIEQATSGGAAVVVVDDGREQRDWVRLGVTAVVPDSFDPATLLAALEAHAPAVRRTGADLAPAGDDTGAARWRGHLVAVTGGNGSGTSTVAMALAQGLAASSGGAGSVVLADLAGCGDLAMYHHVGDVVPGLQELVEVHRAATPPRNVVAQHLYDIEARGYSLLLGLRRPRDWTALPPRALAATIDSMRAGSRFVVADVRADLDGEAETGSVDVEERNAAARLAVGAADVVVVCGDAGLKGVHALVRCERDLGDAGVDARRIVRVVNRAPRSPRQRADLAAAVDDLSPLSGHRVSPVFLAERRRLDVVHAVAAPLPASLCDPLSRAVGSLLASPVP